jgi:hypothetical protein
MLDKWCSDGGKRPIISIGVACPSFTDCPIVGSAHGFEEVSGFPDFVVVGQNLRFHHVGIENDPETLEFLHGIQASNQSAKEFAQQYPAGRQLLLVNNRPARTAAETDPNELFFYSFLNIFGINCELDGEEHSLLVYVQWVLMSALDFSFASQHSYVIQKALTMPSLDGSELSDLFREWATTALERFDPSLYTSKADETESAAPSKTIQLSLKACLVNPADLRVKVKSLMERTEETEKLAMEYFKDEADPDEDTEQLAEILSDDQHTNQAAVSQSKARVLKAQVGDLQNLREEVYAAFHTDMLQHVAWYTVPSTWAELGPEDIDDGGDA